MKKLSFFRCDRCSAIYENAAFAAGMPRCEKCGCRRFTRAGYMTCMEALKYMLFNPSKISTLLWGDVHV